MSALQIITFAVIVVCSAASASAQTDLKRRADEIAARVGKHFYSWREMGAGFAVVGIADSDSVYVKYGSEKIYKMYVRFPSEEWQTEDPFGGKSKDRKILISVLNDIEKRCAA